MLLVAALVLAQGLAGDSRLAVSVSTRSDALTARQWCEDFLMVIWRARPTPPGTTPVRLEVSAEVADHLIVLYAKDKPAHEIMRVVAEHYDWQWVQTEAGGYILSKNPEAIRREEQDLRRAIVAAYKPYREAALESIRKRSDIQREETIRTADSELETIRISEGTHRDRMERTAKVFESVRPVTAAYRVADEIIASLSDDDWLELDRSSRIVFSLRPTAAQRQLPRRLIEDAIALGQSVDPVSVVNPELQRWIAIVPPGVISEEMHLYFVLERPMPAAYSPGQTPEVSASLIVRTIYAAGQLTHLSRRLPLFERYIQPPAKQQSGPEVDVAISVPDDALADADPWPRLREGGYPEPLSGHAKILNEVCAAGGFAVVADVFDHTWAINPDTTVVRKDLKSTLDLLALRSMTEWSIDNGWVILRSPHRAMLASAQSPREAIFRIKEAAWEGDQFGLSAQAAAALTLTDAQCSSLLIRKLTGGWEAAFASRQSGLYFLRWYGSTHTIRLMRGAPRLPLSVTQPHAHAFLQEFANRAFENGLIPFTRQIPELVAWANERIPIEKMHDTPPYEVTQALPFGPLLEFAYVEVARFGTPLLYARRGTEPPRRYPLHMIPLEAMSSFDAWALGGTEILAFFFYFGNDMKTFQLIESHGRPMDADFGRLDQLPQEIRSRIGID